MSPDRGRIHSLDVLRGIAICAVLFVNIIAMSGPQMLAMDPATLGTPSTLDLVVFHVVRVCIEGKFLSIFSLLFGMGLMLQTRRLDAAGASGWVYGRRLGLLLAMGITHGVLLWWGDILTAYALIGGAAFLLRRQPADALRLLGFAVLALGICLASLSYLSLGLLDEASMAQGMEALQAVSFEDGPAWAHGLGESRDLLEVFSRLEVGAFGQGGLLWSTGLRTLLYLGSQTNLFGGYGLVVGGLFLIGMHLVASDFVNDRARQRRWMIRGLVVGVVAEAVGGAVGLLPHVMFLGLGEAIRMFGKPPMALGIFAALLQLCGTGRPRGLLALFASGGRMALTNYLGQSLIVAVLMMHWGFGLFGTLGRAETAGIALAICSAQLVASHLWLRSVGRGPVEALWRWGTYSGSGASSL